jgi:hypothetical protein
MTDFDLPAQDSINRYVKGMSRVRSGKFPEFALGIRRNFGELVSWFLLPASLTRAQTRGSA